MDRLIGVVTKPPHPKWPKKGFELTRTGDGLRWHCVPNTSCEWNPKDVILGAKLILDGVSLQMQGQFQFAFLKHDT